MNRLLGFFLVFLVLVFVWTHFAGRGHQLSISSQGLQRALELRSSTHRTLPATSPSQFQSLYTEN